MNVLVWLIPISLALGGLGLLFFVWTVKTNQYDDPEGDARRILGDEYDRKPRPRPLVGARPQKTSDND